MDSSCNWPNHFKSKGCGNFVENFMVKKKELYLLLSVNMWYVERPLKVRVLLKTWSMDWLPIVTSQQQDQEPVPG